MNIVKKSNYINDEKKLRLLDALKKNFFFDSFMQLLNFILKKVLNTEKVRVSKYKKISLKRFNIEY